jgi:hypothetical protein
VRRLEAGHAEAAALVGERAYRVWRLYMAAFAHGFATARIGVVQVLLAKPDRHGVCALPLSRRDLYRASTTGRDHTGPAPTPATPAAGGAGGGTRSESP